MVCVGGSALAWRVERVEREAIRRPYEATIATLAKSDRRVLRELVKSVDEAQAVGVTISPETRLDLVRALGGLCEGERAKRELDALDPETLPPGLRGAAELAHAAALFGEDDARAERLVTRAPGRELPPAERAYAEGLRAATTPAALDAHRAAVRADPFHLPARTSAGLLLLSLGRHQEARALAEESARLYPEHPDFAVVRVLAAGIQGDEARLAEAALALGEFLPAAEVESIARLARGHAAAGRLLREASGYGAARQSDPADAEAARRFGVWGLGAARAGSVGGLIGRLPPAQRERLGPYRQFVDPAPPAGGRKWDETPEGVEAFAAQAEAHPEGLILMLVARSRFNRVAGLPDGLDRRPVALLARTTTGRRRWR